MRMAGERFALKRQTNTPRGHGTFRETGSKMSFRKRASSFRLNRTDRQGSDSCPDHHERFKSRDDIVSFKSRHIHVVFIKRFGWAAVGETQCIRTVNL